MHFAILDLGTNTFKLLIIEKSELGLKTVFKNKLAVKLGEGGLKNNIIAPRAYIRGINALIEHKKDIERFNCTHIFTFATSGLRSTSNGEEFIVDAKQKAGIDIEIISGDQEAQYIYDGVKKALDIPSNSCIIDIGGGSTEFIIGNQAEILWKKSFKLGVSRLYEKFSPSDPLTNNDINQVEQYLKNELTELLEQLEQHNVKHLIGSSGSFKSFGKIIGLQKQLSPEDYYAEISFEEFKQLHQVFCTSNVFQRLKIDGMETMRADMIPMASTLVNFILNQHEFDRILISKYALKEGVIEKVAAAL